MSTMMRLSQESGFVVSFLFPGFGRVCWSVAIAFMILATSTQFGNGKKLNHLNFKFLYLNFRFSFTILELKGFHFDE